jgi:RNA polymerase sigma-70 factor (ECF subfamily)
VLVARRFVSPEQARDIAQDTWIKYQAQLLKEGPEWPEAKARSWVWAVSSNAARSILRKKPKRSLEPYLLEMPRADSDPARLVADEEDLRLKKELAWEILADLALRDRRLLTLRNLEGRSWREIAKILQENERTLRSRYSRLLARLKRRLVPGEEESHV